MTQSTYKTPRKVWRETLDGPAKHFYCHHGRHWVKEPKPGQCGGTGYGINDKGRAFCYDCAAELDKRSMRETGKFLGYLVRKPGAPTAKERQETGYTDSHGRRGRVFPSHTHHEVTNWPGTLRLALRCMSGGRHNWWGVNRIDVWFDFEGYIWHGVQLSGGCNETIRCKRTKRKSDQSTFR